MVLTGVMTHLLTIRFSHCENYLWGVNLHVSSKETICMLHRAWTPLVWIKTPLLGVCETLCQVHRANTSHKLVLLTSIVARTLSAIGLHDNTYIGWRAICRETGHIFQVYWTRAPRWSDKKGCSSVNGENNAGVTRGLFGCIACQDWRFDAHLQARVLMSLEASAPAWIINRKV